MNKRKLSLHVLTVVVLLFACSSLAHAQATRTWVSGVGDDANPCSRTAPCKTFAGAISKTAAAGEINVLDPGGFGAVTITKSITISSEGFEAGVLVSGTNAIVIAGRDRCRDSAWTRHRGSGDEPGRHQGDPSGALHVEKCTINAFRGSPGSRSRPRRRRQPPTSIRTRSSAITAQGNRAVASLSIPGARQGVARQRPDGKQHFWPQGAGQLEYHGEQ